MRIRDLREQEELISDHETLLDTISHDIKTPITSLLLAVGEFKHMDCKNCPEFPMLLKIVESAVKKLQTVVGELTDTREQQHKYKAEQELLSIEHLLEDVRLTLADNIKESGAIIKTHISTSELTFSRRKLRSVIYNLVSNAIKFKSPERKPEINIETKLEDNFMLISVKDNGIGVDASDQQDIFSKYYRLDNSIEGSGVGLYLVKEIVSNAGGKIILESEPGKGSTFKVYLKAG
jgi:two-component system phosphate regulon sensor histidine kinase PhoR